MIVSREYMKAIKCNRSIPFPYLIQLEITNECPFNCPQCYKKNLGNRHMDFERLKELIIECYNSGTRMFIFNGGEPLLYYKIYDLVDYIKRLDVKVNCFTSGFGLSDKIIDLWDFDRHRLCLSLNGSNKRVNAFSRQGYDITISAMKKLAESKKRYGINWVARHDNVDDFVDMLKICEKYEVSYMFITCEKPTGSDGWLSPLITEDYAKLVQCIKSYKGNIEIIIENCFCELNEMMGRKKDYFSGCFAGKYGCHVNVNFEYSPCTHLTCFEKYSSMVEYWNNLRMVNDISEWSRRCFSKSGRKDE